MISNIHPSLYHLSVTRQRFLRRAHWILNNNRYVRRKQNELLSHKITDHQSLLIRKLGNADPQLQYNKIKNLSLAITGISNTVISPGQTFSLWKLIGKPTVKKGYLPGMILWNGEVRSDIGGGLCQLSNLLYWMVLHTEMIVVERHHHTFDAFPDSGRTLPFGSGATIFYNYLDLQFYNPTDKTFQINIWLTDKHLKGEILADKQSLYSYSIIEKNHAFIKDKRSNTYFRKNDIYRKQFDKHNGNLLQEELICKNYCEVKYTLDRL